MKFSKKNTKKHKKKTPVKNKQIKTYKYFEGEGKYCILEIACEFV